MYTSTKNHDESNKHSIFDEDVQVQSNHPIQITPIKLVARSQPLSDGKVSSFGDFPNLEQQQIIRTHSKKSSDCDDFNAIQDEDANIVKCVQPFGYASESSSDDEDDNVSPTTRYVRKMLTKKSLLNGADTATAASTVVRPEIPCLLLVKAVTPPSSPQTLSHRSPQASYHPELDPYSQEGWTTPRRLRNTPSPECPEVVTPEHNFLKTFSKDPIVQKKAEKLYLESVERERPFWPQSIFHRSSDDDSDDCHNRVQTKRQPSIQVASEDQPMKRENCESLTDQMLFNCAVCDKSFRHKWLLKQHKMIYHNPKYLEAVPTSSCFNGNLIQHMACDVAITNGHVNEDEELVEEEDANMIDVSSDDWDSM